MNLGLFHDIFMNCIGRVRYAAVGTLVTWTGPEMIPIRSNPKLWDDLYIDLKS